MLTLAKIKTFALLIVGTHFKYFKALELPVGGFEVIIEEGSTMVKNRSQNFFGLRYFKSLQLRHGVSLEHDSVHGFQVEF